MTRARRYEPVDDLPRKGMGYWPFWKLFLVMWSMVHGAVFVNTLVIWSATRFYDHYVFDFWGAWIVIMPLTVLGAYFVTEWVRDLVREAEQGR